MKDRIKVFLAPFIFLFFFVFPVHASKSFDFSAMNVLWDIVDILENDQDPSELLWNSLVETPGYSTLISYEGQYGLNFLKRNLKLVFKPSLKSDLENSLSDRSIQHFLDFKKNISKVKDFQKWLTDGPVELDIPLWFLFHSD